MTQDTKAMVAAFEAEFEADWNDPAMKADTEMWSAAWRAATAAKAAPLALAEEAKRLAREYAESKEMATTPLAEIRAAREAMDAAIDRLAAAASPRQPTAGNEDTGAVRIYPPEFPKMPAGALSEQLSREELWGWACLTGWRCASAAPPAVEAGQVLTDERGWLIEHSGELPGCEPGCVSWLCVGLKDHGQREFTYTLDAGKALRFARKEDAQAVLHMHLGSNPAEWYRKPYSVTEHMWPAASTQASPTVETNSPNSLGVPASPSGSTSLRSSDPSRSTPTSARFSDDFEA